MRPSLEVRGVKVFKTLLSRTQQQGIVDEVRAVAQAAPFVRPATPSGKDLSVRMTSAGRFGWITDAQGYRYEPRHPSGVAWPPIPASILEIWEQVSDVERTPESCLINYYDATAKMGMHLDDTEADYQWPVVSVSLGDDAMFRVGGVERGGPTDGIWLQSGDVVVMGGAARLLYHGVARIKAGTSTLLPKGGRINLTMRVVT